MLDHLRSGDKMRLWVAFARDGDKPLALRSAAVGALAMAAPEDGRATRGVLGARRGLGC